MCETRDTIIFAGVIIKRQRLHRRTMGMGGGGGGAGELQPPPRIFQIAILGQKACNIWAKPLDFRASNGENIRATDLNPPKRNWSRTPIWRLINDPCLQWYSLVATLWNEYSFVYSTSLQYFHQLIDKSNLTYTMYTRMCHYNKHISYRPIHAHKMVYTE